MLNWIGKYSLIEKPLGKNGFEIQVKISGQWLGDFVFIYLYFYANKKQQLETYLVLCTIGPIDKPISFFK